MLNDINDKLIKNANGLQSSLRVDLRKIWEECRKKGFAEDSDRADFLNLYDKYHNLGSNGVMDNIKDSLLNLPLEKQQKLKIKKTTN